MAFSRSLTITCARDNWTESENWAGWAGHMGQELVEGKSWVLLEPWPPGPDLSLCQPHTPTARSWTRAWNAKFSTLRLTTITFGWGHLGPGPAFKNFPGFLFVLEIKEALVGCVLSWAPNQMGVLGVLIRLAGQIPEVPWNWHFVWIGVKSSVCPPSALSTQTKRGTLIIASY